MPETINAMWHRVVLVLLATATVFGVASCLSSARAPSGAVLPPDAPRETTVIVVQAFKDGLSGVHAARPNVKLRVGRDPAMPDEPVLLVEYPGPTNDPAARDVRCDAENRNWRAAGAISFRVKPAHAVKLSVSFLDRNGVAYTTWTDLEGGVWQPVRIQFDAIRPNPYFQPPNAKTGAPIDVSDVKFIAFAPHDQTSGSLAISKIEVVK